jgi:hypothetical protein
MRPHRADVASNRERALLACLAVSFVLLKHVLVILVYLLFLLLMCFPLYIRYGSAWLGPVATPPSTPQYCP